jgi:hypothetical protein
MIVVQKFLATPLAEHNINGRCGYFIYETFWIVIAIDQSVALLAKDHAHRHSPTTMSPIRTASPRSISHLTVLTEKMRWPNFQPIPFPIRHISSGPMRRAVRHTAADLA